MAIQSTVIVVPTMWGFIPNSDEYSSYGDSEDFECLTCGNIFRVHTP